MAAKKKPSTPELYSLRALQSFVDVGNGVPVSVSKGNIIRRGEAVATRFVNDGLCEEILDPIHQMVKTAADIGGVAFVTSNPDVTAACAHYQVGCTAPGH